MLRSPRVGSNVTHWAAERSTEPPYGTCANAPDGGDFATLHKFTFPADGANPHGRLLLASDGMLYGTAFTGGSNLQGTVFQLATDGSVFTVLWNFAGLPDGAFPYAGLIQASDGTVFGTTEYGGSNGTGWGTVFQVTPPLLPSPLRIATRPLVNCADRAFDSFLTPSLRKLPPLSSFCRAAAIPDRSVSPRGSA